MGELGGINRGLVGAQNRARSLDSREGKPVLRDKHGCPKHGSGHQPAVSESSQLETEGSNPSGPVLKQLRVNSVR